MTVAAVALVLLAGWLSGQGVSAQDCNNTQSPIFILPGITGSALLATYSSSSGAAGIRDADTSSDLAAAAADAGSTEARSAPLNSTEKALVRRIARVLAAQAVSNSQQQQQLDGSLAAANETAAQGLWSSVCPNAGASNRLQLWVPADLRFLLYKNCFYYAMRVQYNKTSGRFSNSTGSRVFANPGGSSGMEYPLWDLAGYKTLTDYITKTFPGYTAGKNLFALPYDWRLDLTAMEQAYEFDRLASRISQAVASNCGKKAVLIGHSMGTIVSLGLMQNPRFQAWRQQNVKGFIALAPPFGGSTLAAAVRVAGGASNPKNSWLDLLLGSQPVLDVYWGAARGMPSTVMLLPASPAFPADMIVAKTPLRDYTVAQLQELLAATGDQQSVDMYPTVHTLDELIAKGLVPGVETFCIYGNNINTTLSWRFESIVANKRANEGKPIAIGKGDGTVNIQSLRQCRRVTNADKVVELAGNIDHGNVLSDPAAQKEIGKALQQLLAR